MPRFLRWVLSGTESLLDEHVLGSLPYHCECHLALAKLPSPLAVAEPDSTSSNKSGGNKALNLEAPVTAISDSHHAFELQLGDIPDFPLDSSSDSDSGSLSDASDASDTTYSSDLPDLPMSGSSDSDCFIVSVSPPPKK